MDDNIHHLDIVTTVDLPPEKVLKAAMEIDLKQVIIIGIDQDGEHYFAFSHCDPAYMVWLMEVFKHRLITEDFAHHG